VHEEKADNPIEFIVEGNITEVILLHPVKVELPIEVTPSGMITELKF
jgi:hypothetical protein